MNRRTFIKLSVLAGAALALPTRRIVRAAPLHPILHLKNSRITGPEDVPVVNFGPDSPVMELYERDGIWYARVEHAGQPFWLKSYNGRTWGSLDWQPRPQSRQRQ